MFHPTRSSGRVHPQSNTRLRSLRLESLEDRRMLSVAGLDDGSNQAIEVFHAQDALFAENAGQWDMAELPGLPEPSSSQAVPAPVPQPAPVQEVYFGYNKGGTQIYFTEESIEFGLSKRELKDGVDPAAADEIEMGLPGADEDLYDYSSTHFSLNFDGARPTVPTGADQADTVFNYHVGPQENWVDGVATYKRVVYDDLYAGIDLHTFSRHGEMKYEFHVDPGADWSEIRLSYDGIEGLSIGEEGSLCIETELGVIVDEGLYVYQVIEGEEVEVAGAFVLIDGDTYGFEVSGEYDPGVELVIDPEVVWGSYLGGADSDYAEGVATDADGNVYVAGATYSASWLSGGWDTSYGGDRDGFVVKLTPNGTHVWSSFLGGSDADYAYAICTDGAGDVCVAGGTYSKGWVFGGEDISHGGQYDAFIVKLRSDGTHLWSSYLGGSDGDSPTGIASDSAGDIYVAGWTYSNGWVSGGWDTSYGENHDGFVVKLKSDGTHLWSSYLGGTDDDYARSVANDGVGNVYVVGVTYSNGWVSGGGDISLGGERDGFLVKLADDGTHLWSSYVGGEVYDYAYGVATDGVGNVYVAGMTCSNDWVFGGWDTTHVGASDGFVAKFNSTGTYLWGSYIGGADGDSATGVTTDGEGRVYVVGHTSSSDWVFGGWEALHGGARDGFIVELNSDGAHLWSSCLGGANDDYVLGVAMDGTRNLYVAGVTYSDGWVSGGWDTSHEAGKEGFVMRIENNLALVPGDLNTDNQVNSADLDIIRANWGRTVTPGSLLDGDPSGDGSVGSADLDIIRANWGAGVPTAAARTDSEESTEVSTPPLIGPRRASDSALSSWPTPDTARHLSGTDLASLAEAAWMREVEGLRGKGGKKGSRRVVLSETPFLKDEG